MSQKTNKNEDDIINDIRTYIKENIYNYAIMIDGEWGTGKTWFIENKIMKDEELSKDKKFIKVSLYGITSEEEISRKIFYQCNPVAKAGVFVERVLSSVKFSVPLLGVEIKENDFSELINKIDENTKKDNIVLIFDDLERCGMDINQTLGFINNYVECGIKTIIIANEEKINKVNFTNNLELKYMVATDVNIDVSEKTSNTDLASLDILATNDKKNKNDIKTLSVEDIRSRAKKIFSENSTYEVIKEKVIGKTIKYTADMKSVFKSFIGAEEFNLLSTARNSLERNSSKIFEKMDKYQHQNLRTLQAIVSNFNTILLSVESIKNTLEISHYDEILEKCIEETILIKAFGFNKKQRDTESAGHPLYFIRELVNEWNISSENICKLVKNYIDMKEKEEKQQQEYDTIASLNEWWIYEEETLKNKIEELIKQFDDPQKYNDVSLYFKIILRLSELDEIFKKSFVDEIFPKMLTKIDTSNIQSKDINFDLIKLNFPSSPKFDEYFTKIKNACMKINNSVSNEEIWSKFFFDFYNENSRYFYEIKGVWNLIDNKALVEKIKVCENADIFQLRENIVRIKFFEENLSDLKSFAQNLKYMLEEYSRNKLVDSIKKMHIQKLYDEINFIINRLESKYP